MNVQQLIDRLSRIEDKTQPVIIGDFGATEINSVVEIFFDREQRKTRMTNDHSKYNEGLTLIEAVQIR